MIGQLMANDCRPIGASASVAPRTIRYLPGVLPVGMVISYSELNGRIDGHSRQRDDFLPPALARQAEEPAEAEGKSFSAGVQDALRLASKEYTKQQSGGQADIAMARIIARVAVYLADLAFVARPR